MFGYGDRPKNKQQLRIKSYQFFLQFSKIYDTIGIGNICFFNVSFCFFNVSFRYDFVESRVSSLLGGEKLDGILCVAGGW